MTYSMQLDTTPEIAANFQRIATELTDVGEGLVATINAHTANFDGATKDEFMQVQQRYNQAHEQMIQHLNKAQTDLTHIHEIIVEGERRGTQTWQM
ncbi:WXG100 family type VII secretion target [Kutzneria buriramensis]|jgi:WXG100 family type VII secretion target|uniref:WXG100 family type VII secretion target n=1 Tax=Kutzneria buriramensis TaxID=1045776 RepID=A0A3E0H2K6_9PSEU|nr:WXG100 family type VII secretion target [Kutzneria buriramensis]REH37096.1 WXG100 family type VII secretion target [Kutzneria buriramensis]